MPDRPLLYAGQQLPSAQLLRIAQSGMIGDGMLGLLIAGTATVAAGLACGPTSPASMQVIVQPGMIIQTSTVDSSAYGSLGTNTAALQKLGALLTSTTFTLTAPGTSGQSINYLIEASMSETDSGSTVLNYVDSANPSVPWTGPNNDGTAQNTIRGASVGLQIKAGAAATTGTQTTPAADSGWVPLYVITVNYGQTTITSAAISAAAGAPFVGGGAVQTGRYIGTQRFTSSGTYTRSPGAKKICIRYAVGGGGSGGGSLAPGASNCSTCSGGATGSWCANEWFDVTSTATAAVTIGAGGTASSGVGNSGGTTSMVGAGWSISLPGGNGGSVKQDPVTTAFDMSAQGNGGGAPTITGALAAGYASDGAPGPCGFLYSGTVVSGQGASCPSGGGGPNTNGGNGGNAAGYGAGGGGAGVVASGPTVTGGLGSGGIVIIEEYT